MKNYIIKVLSVVLAVMMLVNNSVVSLASELFNKSDQSLIESKILAKVENISVEKLVSDAYYIGDVYVCTSQTPNGMFEYAYNLGDKIVYAKYIDGVLIERHTSDSTVITIEATEEQISSAEKIMNDETLSVREKEIALEKIGYYMYNDGEDVSLYMLDTNGKTRASSYTVGMTELKNKYNVCYDRMCTSSNFYCNYLGVNKTVYVRESRYSFSEITYKSGTFQKGYEIVKAAAALLANPVSIRNWLGFASTATTFEFDAFIHRTSRAKAVRYKYGEVYDTTSENDYVTCYSVTGYDYYVVSNQGSGYDWGVEPTAFADQYPNSTIANEAASSYNTALNMNGYWPWG